MLVMTSAGGLVPVSVAAELPVALLLCGPAGGVRAAATAAASAGYPDAVSLDMGGTSTDVCLIRGGVPEPAAMHEVAGFPCGTRRSTSTRSARAAVRSRGSTPAARSSSARRARARCPGPACYGLGGTAPTVTDADLVLGRIPAGTELPGLGVLDSTQPDGRSTTPGSPPRGSCGSSTRTWSERCEW